MIKTQKELEVACVARGRERYFEAHNKALEGERGYENAAIDKLLREDFDVLLKAMQKKRRECRSRQIAGQTTGRRLGGWEHLLEPIDSRSLAFIAYKTVINHVGRGNTPRIQDVSGTIGRAVATEIRWQQSRKAEAKAAKDREYNPPNRIAMMKRRVKAIEPKSVRKWLRKFDDIATKEWTQREMFLVGAQVLAATLEVLPHVVKEVSYTTTQKGGLRTVKTLRFTPEFIERMAKMHDEISLLTPWLLPMIEVPKDWTITGNKAEGGYYHLREKFLKVNGGRVHHTKVGDVSSEMVEAVNLIQKTPWQINQPVLQVALKALETDTGPLPYEPEKPFPPAVSSEEWAKMTTQERGVVKRTREAVHSHNNGQVARKLTTHRVKHIATMMGEYERFWFPHSLDWRGRVYPLPHDLHPQANDFARSLLTFAEGKPLGEHGLKWLVFHLANCYGVDKGSREDQAEWYNEHAEEIFAVASDPLGEGLEFWSKADEPWQFLAAAIEVCRAFVLSDPTAYVSTLPVHIDGSCNGLQHLSAMGLDPVGAHAVNLLPGPRQDIYQIVADKVAGAIDADLTRDIAKREGLRHWGETPPEAKAWAMKVNRKVVKRGVMTTPYGVTPIGIRDQLIKDGWCRDLPGDTMANANYMRDRMQEAISSTIVKGTEIMQWFQDCASILSENDKGISWVTPAGMRVTQCYRQQTGVRINTLMGKLLLSGEDVGEINKRKQMSSVAPNIIHSFDAAHMALTVLNTKDDGVSYSVIHDSFGTHAGDMEDFAHSTRVVFASIYKEDWFWEFKNDFQKQGAKYLTQEPQRGDLNIVQVVDAEYFFA